MFPTHRSVRLLAALATAAALVALPALAPAGQTNTVQLSAKLKGNQEVPGPGDRNGKGEGFVSVKAHSVAGNGLGIEELLFDQTPPTSTVEDSVKDLKKKLLKRIAKSPEKFYVNLHNAAYPDGAIRGQLGLAL